jgi:antitoxin CptB
MSGMGGDGRFAASWDQGTGMDDDMRRRRLSYRAWHRGTREADFLVGGFFDAHGSGWNAEQIDWFERIIEEQDVDILAWAFGKVDPPAHYEGPMMHALRRLDYIEIPR